MTDRNSDDVDKHGGMSFEELMAESSVADETDPDLADICTDAEADAFAEQLARRKPATATKSTSDDVPETGDAPIPAACEIQTFPRRIFPCGPCPIRADNAGNPESMFPAERWVALTASVVDPVTGYGPSMDAPMFGCHKGAPSTNADLACAGWLVRFGPDHPRVRLAALCGRIPGHAFQPGDNWPPLHATWEEVVRHHTLPEDVDDH